MISVSDAGQATLQKKINGKPIEGMLPQPLNGTFTNATYVDTDKTMKSLSFTWGQLPSSIRRPRGLAIVVAADGHNDGQVLAEFTLVSAGPATHVRARAADRPARRAQTFRCAARSDPDGIPHPFWAR